MIRSASEVNRLVRQLVAEGAEILFTNHAVDRMVERRIVEADILNVLRGGWCDETCTEQDARGRVTYRITTNRLYVVIRQLVEPEPDRILIITVVRIGRR